MSLKVAVLALVASVSAGVLPAGYAAYGAYNYPLAYGYTAAAPTYTYATAAAAPTYTYAAAAPAYTYAAAPAYTYAAQPYAAAVAPVAGVYAGTYDASVAYSQMYPLAEPYIDGQVEAEAYGSKVRGG